MTDYTEIIDALRHCAEDGFDSCENCPFGGDPDSCAGLAKKAAEAIEKMLAFINQIQDGCLYIVKDGVLYEGKVQPPAGKVLQIPPIEFAEPPKEET